MWEHGVYAQDDYKVTRKLTLNYGLRWDCIPFLTTRIGLYYNFDPKTFSIVVPDEQALANISPAWPVATFPVVTAGQAAISQQASKHLE